jgi:hypothetical protein
MRCCKSPKRNDNALTIRASPLQYARFFGHEREQISAQRQAEGLRLVGLFQQLDRSRHKRRFHQARSRRPTF